MEVPVHVVFRCQAAVTQPAQEKTDADVCTQSSETEAVVQIWSEQRDSLLFTDGREMNDALICC